MNEQETIADIIAEMRKTKYGDAECEVKWCLTQWADRLEAALKRESGNCAKLREACANIAEYARSAMCHTTDTHVLGYLNQIEGWAKAALAAPPRNCDMGTAEEQSARFDKFCHANINTQRCCGDCPAFRTTRDDCELVWAQMPYEPEEGGDR